MTDGLPALALALEPPEQGVMRRPPRPPGEHVLAGGMARAIATGGVATGTLSLLAGYLAWRGGHPAWQTMVFTALTFVQLGNVMGLRSERESLFRQGLRSNRALAGAVILTALLQAAVVYLPPLQGIFRTIPLAPGEFLLCVALGGAGFGTQELLKWRDRRSRR